MKNAASVFFVGFPGVRVSGKQCKCMDTCFFCAPTGAAKMLVGVAPQTRRTSGHRDQKQGQPGNGVGPFPLCQSVRMAESWASRSDSGPHRSA